MLVILDFLSTYECISFLKFSNYYFAMKKLLLLQFLFFQTKNFFLILQKITEQISYKLEKLPLSLENILLQSLTEHAKFKITQLPVPTERNLSSSTPLVIIKQTVVKPLPCKQT